jgi:hypothetical protein
LLRMLKSATQQKLHSSTVAGNTIKKELKKILM